MTEGLRSIRPLGLESLRGLEPADVGRKRPTFEWVDPKTLYVEEAYQRAIGEAQTKLIRKIYAGFSWARFKPPVCVRLLESGNVLVCIDGQGTATAAASHPGVGKIPVMVVDAADLEARAGAFVGHNRDRVGLTQQAIFRAELAHGDPIAGAVERACKAAGATILGQAVNLRDKHPVGSTIAIGTMKAFVKRRGEDLLVRALKVLVAAGRGPIKAGEIIATGLILQEFEPCGERVLAAAEHDLRKVIVWKTPHAWAAQATLDAGAGGLKIGPAIAAAWRTALKKLIAEAAPAKPAVAPAQPSVAPKPADPAQVVERNGVVLDLVTGRLTHRGKTVKLQREADVVAVAALARVMPALHDQKRLLAKVYPGEGAEAFFRALVERLKPILCAARLEIRVVPKAGSMLIDLGE
jgi:hypothetical protein